MKLELLDGPLERLLGRTLERRLDGTLAHSRYIGALNNCIAYHGARQRSHYVRLSLTDKMQIHVEASEVFLRSEKYCGVVVGVNCVVGASHKESISDISTS